MKMYEVGGCVRDELLGVTSKDIDYTVVLEDEERAFMVDSPIYNEKPGDPFRFMAGQLAHQGFKIFLETPEFLTVRAQFPRHLGVGNKTADFVLARKEGEYTDGRRPDKVEPGTLEDDLARRDFTINAMAKDTDGTLIDPFNGREDLSRRLIRTVGDPLERFTEDALRPLRALRFAVTKGFSIDPDTRTAMQTDTVLNLIRTRISDERKREELNKMFAFDTEASLFILAKYPQLTRAVFSGTVSLDATMKKRK